MKKLGVLPVSYRFRIVAGSIDVLNAFLLNEFHGISISHESEHTSKPRPSPKMAYDTAEDILRFIITASYNIDIGLLTACLYQAAANSERKKTTINGQQIPMDQSELAALIVTLIKEQEDQANSLSEGIES